MSNSASGLSGAEGLGEGDDLDLGLGEGEEEAGAEEEEGGVDDLDFERGDEGGVSAGVGEAFPKGFTGPVGFRGAGGGDFVAGLGEGEGEGAADTLESGRQMASAKMKERNLMKLRWTGRFAGDAHETAAPPIFTSKSPRRHCSIHRAHLRRRFARCQKFPHERSSFRPERAFS
jgi:hypothetical protein